MALPCGRPRWPPVCGRCTSVVDHVARPEPGRATKGTIRVRCIAPNVPRTGDVLSGTWAFPIAGIVVVRVVAADGTPVEGGRVHCSDRSVPAASTDAHGVSVLRRVREGRLWVWADARGHLGMRCDVEVVAVAVHHVYLEEPRGAELAVAVVDRAGRRVPFAGVSLSATDGCTHCAFDADATTQRIDDLTDVEGRRVFARVVPGTIRVVVTHPSGKGEARVDLEDRRRTAVTVVID